MTNFEEKKGVLTAPQFLGLVLEHKGVYCYDCNPKLGHPWHNINNSYLEIPYSGNCITANPLAGSRLLLDIGELYRF